MPQPSILHAAMILDQLVIDVDMFVALMRYTVAFIIIANPGYSFQYKSTAMSWH